MISEYTKDPMLRLIDRLRLVESDIDHLGHFEPHAHPGLLDEVRFLVVKDEGLNLTTVERLENQGWYVVQDKAMPTIIQLGLRNHTLIFDNNPK